jgi:hypothetical protein
MSPATAIFVSIVAALVVAGVLTGLELVGGIWVLIAPAIVAVAWIVFGVVMAKTNL